MVTMPAAPKWHGVTVAPGLDIEWQPCIPFADVWEEGPQQMHELRYPPYTTDTICHRLQGLTSLDFASYKNIRGLWISCLSQLFVWHVKSGRDISASKRLIVPVLSGSLQKLPAMQPQFVRISKAETQVGVDAEDRICEMIWLTDKVFIPMDRAQMLLALQSLRWEDGQTAFSLWQHMDIVRVRHDELPKTLCDQYLSNVHVVMSSEESRGFNGANPSPRWTLAVEILSLTQALLVRPLPDANLLEQIRLVLDRDKRYAQTPLPPSGTGRVRDRGRDAGGYHSQGYLGEGIGSDSALEMQLQEMRVSQQSQQRLIDALVAGNSGGPLSGPSGSSLSQSASGGRVRDYKGHQGVPGCADLPMIVATGKIYPTDWLGDEFNPARKDGKVTHKECKGCGTHNPVITATWDYKKMKEMNGGFDPTRNAQTNKGPRTLQPNEVMPHHKGRCYDVWDDLWAYKREHPDDPDAIRFTTPLGAEQLQVRLTQHRVNNGY
jgi:hypothetical protein